jgi:hypothetical protein
VTAEASKQTGTDGKVGKKGAGLGSGLGFRLELRGPDLMRRWSKYAGPGLDCIRLRSVGCRKHTKKQANLQGEDEKKLARDGEFRRAG